MNGEFTSLIGKLVVYAIIGFFISRLRGSRERVLVRLMTLLILGPATFVAFIFALSGGVLPIAIFLFACLLWLGGPLSAHVATPAGLPRVASAIASVGAFAYHVDRKGLGSIAAARSCLVLRNRRHRLPDAALGRLEQRIAKTAVLRPGTVVARGLTCLAVGDREQARILFKSVGDFAPSLRSGPPQLYAARWLIADAASRGDWSAIQALPKRLDTTLTRFAADCATRIKTGPTAVTTRRLIQRWLLTSSRFATWPLLRMGMRAQAPVVSPVVAPLLARHVAALKGHGTPQDLLWLATDWAATLGDLPEPVRATVQSDLLAMASAFPDVRGRHPFFAAEGDDVLRAFDIAIESLRQRIEDQRWLSPIDEWVELAMLRELFEELALEPSHRRLAFDALRHLITNYGAELFNKRKQKPIGNALFLWMEREAKAAQDDEIYNINKKNVACGFG